MMLAYGSSVSRWPLAREISLMQLELRRARLERGGDGEVAAHGQRLRAAHAEQLVGRFDGAGEIEVVQEPRIVDRGLRRRAAAARGRRSAAEPIATQRAPLPESLRASASLRATRMSKCCVQ